MPNHKLHYRTMFQGMPVSVENRKGSKRHWYDPHNDTHGYTKMKYPYGYVRGTLGTDGDEVDVYIGNDKTSDRVFVITQNKAPEFKDIDEQKVMLGFDSPEKAKLAYLAHYDNKRFFRTLKELTISDFKQKLRAQKGKLIKGSLLDTTNSGKISTGIDPTNTKDDSMTAANAFDELSKALSSRFASSLAKRARLLAKVSTHPRTEFASVSGIARIAETQPLLGTSRERLAGEPTVVPVRSIHNTVTSPQEEPAVFKSCAGCGRMSKSLTCISCDTRQEATATPIWKR